MSVAPGSNRKVWWECKKGHEWQATVSNRDSGRGCPYCKGKAVCEDNCLETVNPDLAKEWHPTLNGRLTPKDVTRSSGRKVWWLCKKGHVWKAAVNERNSGKGCRRCWLLFMRSWKK